MEAKKRMVNRCTFRFSSKLNKRAQVTIFIIVGIVLVFAFAALLYFTRTTATQEIGAQEEPISVAVPQEFQPLQKYTEDCLFEIGKRGLKILGERGGYIYPDQVGKYSADDPSSSDGILIGSQAVPFWRYNKQPNHLKQLEFVSLQPKLYFKDDQVYSVEAQLGRYAREQLNDCLDDYTSFQEKMQVEFLEGGIKEVRARVGETGVNFILEMPLRATQGQSVHEMEQFVVKVPIHFKHYYEVASLITEAEQNYTFLETQGLELISIYSRKDPTYLAPITDESFEKVSFLQWEVTDLQEKYRGLLISYVPMLRFLGSSNFYRATFPEGEILAQKVVDNMVLTLNGAEDLDVSFDYLGWKPYLKVNSKDGKLKPESIHVNFWSFDYSQQRFDTHYDISYPALITVSDKNAFDGEGYKLVFGLESNIRNNKPARANETWSVTTPQISIPLSCDESFLTSGVVKTTVIDAYSKKPLEGVKIDFSIPNQESCDIGVTDESGQISTPLPSVYGGLMSLVKEEYLTDFYPINTYKFKPNSTNLIGYSVEGVKAPKVIEMYPIKTVNVTLMKKGFGECIGYLECDYGANDYIVDCYDNGKEACFFKSGNNSLKLVNPTYTYEVNMSRSRYHSLYYQDREVPLTENETALITLERIDDGQSKLKFAPFTATATITGNGTAEMQLVPGKYNVIATVTATGNLWIPKEKRCAKWSDYKTCMYFDEIKVDKYLLGKIDLADDQALEIYGDQLYTADKVTFFIPVFDPTQNPPLFGSSDHPLNGVVTETLSLGSKMDVIFTLRPELYYSLEPRFETKGEQS
jgi:hypothetical protein